MTDTLGRHFAITGRVQGVGFRWWTRDTALQFGLSGWVRNLSDGRVECWATGAVSGLDAFEQRLAEGPPAANVTAVEATYDTGSDEAPVSGFEVRR